MHPAEQAFSPVDLMTPAAALGLMCARRRASSFNLTRGGPLAPPASSLTATPEPATLQSTSTPLAALPVAAKAAAAPPPAAAVTAAQSVPALDPPPEEDENELSSTSSTSSHTGTSANCAHAQASSSTSASSSSHSRTVSPCTGPSSRGR